MTKYLSLSGSNQYFVTPSIQFDEIQMDYIAYESFNGGYLYHIDARTSTVTNAPYLLTDGSKNEVFSSFTSLSVNGANVASGTNSISNGQRIQIVAKNASITVPITFFSRYNIMQFMKGDVYDVKILLGGVIKAHYDMSTGTVNDQSGNGNNATLTGGTWLDDGSGGTPTGTTYTASLSDSISTLDSISKNLTIVIADNIAFNDSASEIKGKNKNFTDSITLLDSISKQLNRSLSDSISASETSDKDKYKSFNDTISPQDTVNQSSHYNKQLSDSMSFLDSITNYQGKAINLYDSISIVDAISKSLDKHVNDFVSSGDGEQYATDKTLLDAISSSDIITTNEGKFILLSDSVNLSDAINKAISQIKLDSISSSDTLTQQSHINLQLYDVIVTTDTFNIHLPNAPTLIGTIELQGKCELNIYLKGTRQLDLNFKGVIQ